MKTLELTTATVLGFKIGGCAHIYLFSGSQSEAIKDLHEKTGKLAQYGHTKSGRPGLCKLDFTLSLN